MLYKRAVELQCHTGHCIIQMFSNPQYNLSSLCIKEMQNLPPADEIKVAWEPLDHDQTKIKEKVYSYHPPGQHQDVALMQLQTPSLI